MLKSSNLPSADYIMECCSARLVKFSQILATDVNGDLTVTFPGGLFANPPVVQAQVVAGAVGDQYTVETIGAPTITTCVLKVRKMAGLSLSILSLGVVQLFQSPGVTPVHVTATDPI